MDIILIMIAVGLLSIATVMVPGGPMIYHSWGKDHALILLAIVGCVYGSFLITKIPPVTKVTYGTNIQIGLNEELDTGRKVEITTISHPYSAREPKTIYRFVDEKGEVENVQGEK